MMSNYFSIIDEANIQLLKLINEINIASTQWFPIFGFHKICPLIGKAKQLKDQQKSKLNTYLASLNGNVKSTHTSVQAIQDDEQISGASKVNAVIWSVSNDNLDLDDVASFLQGMQNKKDTHYRRLLCAYDFRKYGEE